jgi:ribosomal protein S18 acetylase RimI-like enzyme
MVKIRPATPADVPAVLPMVDKICVLHRAWDSAKYGFLPNPAQRYEKWLVGRAKSDRDIFLVAETTSDSPDQSVQLVAFLVATIEAEIPIYDLREYGFIHDLWVEADYRKAGIGKQIVKAALEQFTQAGIQQVRLDTAAANDAARRLFQSCGFRISTIEMLTEIGE